MLALLTAQRISNIEKKGDFICGVKTQSIRKAFLLSLLQKDNIPTFHEVRSLSARSYEDEKGANFSQKILGHKSMQMTDWYFLQVYFRYLSFIGDNTLKASIKRLKIFQMRQSS